MLTDLSQLEFALPEEIKQLADLAQDGIAFANEFDKLKENVDLRCFLVLAISLDGNIDNAIKTLQSILARNPNTHRSR